MNRNIKNIIKTLFFIFGALAILSACKTKQIASELSHEKEVTNSEKVASETEEASIVRERYDFLKENRLLSSYMNLFDFSYDGKENDKASVVLEQTEKGLRMDIQGAMRANMKQESSKQEENHTKINYEKIDSIVDKKITENISQITEMIRHQNSRTKEVQVKGLQFGMFALLAILITIVVFSFAIYIYIKKLT
ncbi:Uncharacterised protein [Weeksella virosa]|uniref:Lipoprotein n=1 Tax=Weeksella virosa (strain ATCC 43766 / DSM 16922 / JCM 21250 / CCUG 30538 / CDC 9751 / IAM 14551 / NBRC 16016 / NCTC 11634 / CL345/78) TaxID=865938 RepID=F0NXP7_WEEVC|nr:hypothetical protein [Weeksella virosa]ADX66954.1 hypothetical protein Weevi_0232 [Weeksella virosa DSM 16922]VEH63317.1 Uncharacterised protein [Weeksella virosa]